MDNGKKIIAGLAALAALIYIIDYFRPHPSTNTEKVAVAKEKVSGAKLTQSEKSPSVDRPLEIDHSVRNEISSSANVPQSALSEEMKMALQQAPKADLHLSNSNYQFVDGIKAIDKMNYTSSLGKKLTEWGGLILFQDPSINARHFDLKEGERAILLNKTNGQIAVMSNRLILKLYRAEDIGEILERYKLQVHYAIPKLNSFHVSSRIAADLLKNFYLLKESDLVQEAELEIIENPSVPK